LIDNGFRSQWKLNDFFVVLFSDWQQAAVLGTVAHASIVQFHGVVRTPTQFCLVMELLNGGELFDRIIEQKHGYPEDVACKYVTNMLEAVEHLHQHGVVHRDIKPENFLFDEHSTGALLKLIDFGFATFQNPNGDMSGSSCGTPDYIAPELLLERPHNQVRTSLHFTPPLSFFFFCILCVLLVACLLGFLFSSFFLLFFSPVKRQIDNFHFSLCFFFVSFPSGRGYLEHRCGAVHIIMRFPPILC
jgi:serine/threonine protein kinase